MTDMTPPRLTRAARPRARVLAAIAGALAALVGVAGTAAAAPATATTTVNMRAGPSTDYPVVTVVPGGAQLTVYGCLADRSWCDVGRGAARGFVAARYLQVAAGGRTVVVAAAALPVVTFDAAYWHVHYRAYPFYARGPAYYAPARATARRVTRRQAAAHTVVTPRAVVTPNRVIVRR